MSLFDKQDRKEKEEAFCASDITVAGPWIPYLESFVKIIQFLSGNKSVFAEHDPLRIYKFAGLPRKWLKTSDILN